MGGEIRKGLELGVGCGWSTGGGEGGGRLMREAGTARSWGLGCRLKLGLVGSRQGADICRRGQVQVARECKVTVVVHISDQEAEEARWPRVGFVVLEWEARKRPAPRSQGGRRVQGITG